MCLHTCSIRFNDRSLFSNIASVTQKSTSSCEDARTRWSFSDVFFQIADNINPSFNRCCNRNCPIDI
ncbi:unnamed protein product [Linum trigynum]|uniref:Uncharacterized protein n=1 Tax=Linum trigynum TaxID=586398 RepID=A0AAV2ENZ8_9ROSI